MSFSNAFGSELQNLLTKWIVRAWGKNESGVSYQLHLYWAPTMHWVLCSTLGIQGLLKQSLDVATAHCAWRYRKSQKLKDNEILSLVLDLVRINCLKTIKVEMNEWSDLEKKIELVLRI